MFKVLDLALNMNFEVFILFDESCFASLRVAEVCHAEEAIHPLRQLRLVVPAVGEEQDPLDPAPAYKILYNLSK